MSILMFVNAFTILEKYAERSNVLKKNSIKLLYKNINITVCFPSDTLSTNIQVNIETYFIAVGCQYNVIRKITLHIVLLIKILTKIL